VPTIALTVKQTKGKTMDNQKIETQIVIKMSLNNFTRIEAIEEIKKEQNFINSNKVNIDNTESLNKIGVKNSAGTFLVEVKNGFAHYHNEKGIF